MMRRSWPGRHVDWMFQGEERPLHIPYHLRYKPEEDSVAMANTEAGKGVSVCEEGGVGMQC